MTTASFSVLPDMGKLKGPAPQSDNNYNYNLKPSNNDMSIVNSVTQDEDDDDYNSSSAAPLLPLPLPKEEGYRPSSPLPSYNTLKMDQQETTVPSPTDHPAELFLTKYDHMMRSQDDEWSATLEHLKPLFQNLKTLVSSNEPVTDLLNDSFLPPLYELEQEEFTYRQLHLALQILQQQQQQQQQEDDDTLVMIKMDEQLMLVLQVLTDHVPTDNASAAAAITWLELAQCYRLCVSGMLTLEYAAQGSAVRSRIKERTMAAMRLFAAEYKHSTVLTETQTEVAVEVQSEEEESSSSSRTFSRTCSMIGLVFMAFFMALSNPQWPQMETILSNIDTFASTNRFKSFKENFRAVPEYDDFRHLYEPIAGPLVSPYPKLVSDMGPIRRDVPTGPPASVQRNFLHEPFDMNEVHAGSLVRDERDERSSSSLPSATEEHSTTIPSKNDFSKRQSEQLTSSKKAKVSTSIIGGVLTSAGVVAAVIQAASPTLAAMAPVGVTVVVATFVAHGIKAVFLQVLSSSQN